MLCCAKLLQSCPPLCHPMDCSPAVSSVHGTGFSRREYWNGWPCLPLGDLPNQGIGPMSPALADRSHQCHLGSPRIQIPTAKFLCRQIVSGSSSFLVHENFHLTVLISGFIIKMLEENHAYFSLISISLMRSKMEHSFSIKMYHSYFFSNLNVLHTSKGSILSSFC